MIKDERFPLTTKISLGVLLIAILVFVMQVWHPFQRQPIMFYYPMITPIEAIAGDIIVLPSGGYIPIEYNERINSVDYDNDKLTINATRHMTIWQIITER